MGTVGLAWMWLEARPSAAGVSVAGRVQALMPEVHMPSVRAHNFTATLLQHVRCICQAAQSIEGYAKGYGLELACDNFCSTERVYPAFVCCSLDASLTQDSESKRPINSEGEYSLPRPVAKPPRLPGCMHAAHMQLLVRGLA